MNTAENRHFQRSIEENLSNGLGADARSQTGKHGPWIDVSKDVQYKIL
jgi:hypothetical protein